MPASGIPRHGSVFIFTFGLLLVMVALAYSFMVSTRIRRDANEAVNMRAFAELAAQQGANHVIQVLTADYLSQPNVPTHLGLSYRRSFAPIDTDRVGKHLTSAVNANAGNYRPVGDPATWEDENENDTKTESLISVVYNSIYAGGGTYSYRGDAFNRGKMLTNGLGRYIEPGHYHSDLIGKPLSFHLEHPVSANPASPDPAIRRGEPWTADIDDPLYLDVDLQPVSTRNEARYRLRYAVTVEDLSGHLPMSWQGEYNHGIPSAITGPITATETALVSEVNTAIGTQYRDAFYNLFGGSKAWWGFFAANGLGFTNFTPATDTNHSTERYRVLSHISTGSVYHYHQSSSSSRPDLTLPFTYGNVWATHRGPVASAGSGRAFSVRQTSPSLAYTYTPYGRQPVTVAAPSAWRDSYVDCPWQLNLPTAVPEAVTRMIYAYLPREALTFLYNKRHIYTCTGINATTGAANWSTPVTTDVTELTSIGMLDLFASPDFSVHFSHLPATQPYPGTSPGSGGPDWREGLGKDINLNTTVFGLTGLGTPPDHKKVTPRAPFWGMRGTYLPDLKNDYTELENPVVGGQKWVLTMPSASMQGLTKAEGYWYEDSYYMDLAVALFHTVSLAQLAWLPDNGGAWDGDALAGRPQYPVTVTNPDLLPLLADGLPSGRDRDMLDFDADGDGTAESPSAFDTIKEVDAQFVRNMGEYFGPVTSGDPAVPAQGLYVVKVTPTSYGDSVYVSRAEAVAWTINHNIASLLLVPLDIPNPAHNPASPDPTIPATIPNPVKRLTPGEAAMMELALNDMRMSFFGASPQYPDFQGIDFDNNGTVRCSAYAGGTSPADMTTRFGRVIDPGMGDERFSLTGCFLFQKSRFFRAFIRGEVFDTLRMVPAEATTLEMVYAVDPNGQLYDVNNVANPTLRDPNGDGNTNDAVITDSQVLFQRWHWIRHQLYKARAN